MTGVREQVMCRVQVLEDGSNLSTWRRMQDDMVLYNNTWM